MSNGKTKTATADDTVTEKPDGPEVPEWAVIAEDAAQLAEFRGVSTSQWRRKLSGPELLQYVADCVKELDGKETAAMALEIANQIAAASTVEEVLNGSDVTKGKEVLDVTLAIDAIKFIESAHEDGCPFFAVLSGRNTKTNELDTFSIGGWRTVLQLAWMHYSARELMAGSPYLADAENPDAIERQTYPFFFKMQKVKTRSGNEMNRLVHPMQP